MRIRNRDDTELREFYMRSQELIWIREIKKVIVGGRCAAVSSRPIGLTTHCNSDHAEPGHASIPRCRQMAWPGCRRSLWTEDDIVWCQFRRRLELASLLIEMSVHVDEGDKASLVVMNGVW